MAVDERVKQVWRGPEKAPMLRYQMMGRRYREALKHSEQRVSDLLSILSRIEVVLPTELFTDVNQEVLLGEQSERADLDRSYFEQGERWHLDEGQTFTEEYTDDDWLPVREMVVQMSKEFGFANTSMHWLTSARSFGRIDGLPNPAGPGHIYRVGDVRQLLKEYDGRPYSAGGQEIGRSRNRKPKG